MSLYKEWTKLIGDQTDATFEKFWEEYAAAESKIYADILKNKKQHVEGTIDDFVKEYEVRPVMFMGFLDGIQSSLEKSFDLEKLKEDDKIKMDIIWEKLFFNMIEAEAQHLYDLEEWENIYTVEERQEIADKWRRSRTVVKEKTPGRNDPCPCGSGKKYKKCCGANK